MPVAGKGGVLSLSTQSDVLSGFSDHAI
jgi:hypothetical protein